MTTKQMKYVLNQLLVIVDGVSGRIPTEQDGLALLSQADEMLKLTEKSRQADKSLDEWLKLTYEAVMTDWIRSQREGVPL